MNVDKLFRILGIQYKIRHRGIGDVAYTVKCPYCSSGSHKHKDNSGAFLVYNDKIRYTCWRGCSASVVEVLSELSGESVNDVKDALALCSDYYKKEVKEDEKGIFVLPDNIGLNQRYRNYLSYRGLDADYVTKKYNLRFTPEEPYVYSNMNMSKCIVFPIYNFNNKPVSFTARTTSSTSVIRYLFPPANIEEESGKDIGFGHNGVENKDFVVITEGVFDALKLDSAGVPAIACLGINYTHGFVTNIVKNYKSAVVLFDPEPQAQSQQMKLLNELSLLISTYSIQFPFNHDLGDCMYGELQTVKELIKNKRNF